jgi:hypothetical protein
MIPQRTKSTLTLQIEHEALTAIFKRIAERGHKVRMQTNLEGSPIPKLQAKETKCEQSSQIANVNKESK